MSNAIVIEKAHSFARNMELGEDWVNGIDLEALAARCTFDDLLAPQLLDFTFDIFALAIQKNDHALAAYYEKLCDDGDSSSADIYNACHGQADEFADNYPVPEEFRREMDEALGVGEPVPETAVSEDAPGKEPPLEVPPTSPPWLPGVSTERVIKAAKDAADGIEEPPVQEDLLPAPYHEVEEDPVVPLKFPPSPVLTARKPHPVPPPPLPEPPAVKEFESETGRGFRMGCRRRQ